MSTDAPSLAARADAPNSKISWWTDGAAAVGLFVLFAALRPLMPGGDGMAYFARAVKNGALQEPVTKHLLYVPMLHGVHRTLDAFGLRRFTIEAFTLISNLAGVLLYLVLARGVFAQLVSDAWLARLAALGTLVSFGVLSECVAIETYSVALLLDMALVAVCLNYDLATWRGGVGAGVLYALAVGTHASNILLLPFVLVFLYRDVRKRCLWTSSWFVGTVLVAALLMAAGTLIGLGASLWPPDWRRLIPQADPEPTMSLLARLGRTVYGIARTLAWLPPSWELTRTYVICYTLALLVAGLLFLAVARRGFFQVLGRYRTHGLLAILLVVPYFVLGVSYYPSDPERWLFLTPLFWLLVALAWVEYRPAVGAWLTTTRARWFLASLIVALAAANTFLQLWPEARSNRDLAGFHALADTAQAGDLVIAIGGKSDLDEEYILQRPLTYDVYALDTLMLREHCRDVRGAQEALRNRVSGALRQGQRVLVFQLIDEGLQTGRGYPWSFVANDGFSPDTLLSVLAEFRPEPLRPPTAECAGIYRLRGER